MKKIEQIDIDSEQSEQLKDEELMAINRHFKNRRTNRNSKFAPEMESLYKQALMNVIFGQFEQASKKLKHLITLYPDHPDSFHLLATIHQQIGQQDKAVEYFFMHTYLSPPSLQKWVKVADMSVNLKMYTQAAYCYGRALKIQNYNIQLLTKRAEAFQLSYQSKKAISTYKKILAITKSIPVLKKYAKLRFKKGEYSMARQILMSAQNHQSDHHLAYMISQTYLKQQKYQNLLEYNSGYIKNQIKKDPEFNINSLLLEFIKIIFICLIKLKKDRFQILNITINDIKKNLIDNYDQQSAELYQDLIQCLKSQGTYSFQLLEFLIKHRPHKTIQNYLLYTQYLKQKKYYQDAIKILSQGLNIHKNSVQLTSQLNHIKVISGKWKNNNLKKLKNQKNLTIYHKSQNMFKNQNIFYSDQQQIQQQEEEERQKDKIDFFNHEQQQLTYEKIQKKQNQPSKKRNNKDKKNVVINQNKNNKKQIQTQDPEMIRRLIENCKITLQSIVNYDLESKNLTLKGFKQVQQCIQFIIRITSNFKQSQKLQKDGLFNRKHRRRRLHSSKKSQRNNLITQNLKIILQIIQNSVQYMKALLKNSNFTKAKYLAQIFSKAYFFRWQNKSIQLKKQKETIYQIGLIACLYLQKFQTAVFFVRYLAHKQPQNCLYLLIVNYLIHNSNTRISMNSFLNKKSSQNITVNNQRKESIVQSIQENGHYMNKIQEQKNNDKIYEQEQQEQQNQSIGMSYNDKDVDEISSYPRKFSNISNLSDILRDNFKLNYLFGIQYMQTGCFQLAISSFIKILNICQGQIKKTLWLSLTSCFLQISSSRTCHSKLLYTNRSSYCLYEYLKITKDKIQAIYNKARWFAQIKMNKKAIDQYQKILNMQVQNQQIKQIQIKSAYCLICIYKDMENWEKVNQISDKYFKIRE